MIRVVTTWGALILALLTADAAASNINSLKSLKGAEVWFAEDHTVPVIALEASLPAGSAYDPAGKAGLASFAGSMLDEGAGPLDSKAFHDALATRAIELSVTADRDYLQITLLTESENARDAFRLLGLALQHPRFDVDAVARVRAQILEDLASGDDEPEVVATRAFYGTYFAGHPYAHPPDGDAAGVSAILQNDLKAFARTHWVRGGLKIALSGDVSAAEASALLASAFSGLPQHEPATPPPVVRTATPGIRVIDMPLPQPTAVFGLPGVLRSDPDFIAAYVANYIVGGGGFSSRLTTEVRVNRGLTYGISTDLVTYGRAGLVLGEVATRRESVHQSIAVMRAVLKKFAAEGATEQELADAKTYLTGSFPLAFASNAGLASQMGTFQRLGLGPDYVAKRNGLIESVTLQDIRRVAKRLFDPARLTVVIAGTPAEKIAKAHR
jgi:zinc protease